MGFLKRLWESVKFLLQMRTGLGRKPEALSEAGEAAAAVFLPLAGVIIGFAAAIVAVVFQSFGFHNVYVVLGLAVLALLGGVRQFASSAKLIGGNGFSAGSAFAAALIVLFEATALIDIGSMRGTGTACNTLLYLPVPGVLAMLSAASAMGEPDERLPLSGVKALHLVLGSLLAFVLMLPQYGMLSLLLVAVAVLSGAVMALLAGKKQYRAEALYAAALVSELLFLVIMLLTAKSNIIYY